MVHRLEAWVMTHKRWCTANGEKLSLGVCALKPDRANSETAATIGRSAKNLIAGNQTHTVTEEAKPQSRASCATDSDALTEY